MPSMYKFSCSLLPEIFKKIAPFFLELWSEQMSNCSPSKCRKTTLLQKGTVFSPWKNDAHRNSFHTVCSASSRLSHQRSQTHSLFVISEKIAGQCPSTKSNKSIRQNVFDWKEQEKNRHHRVSHPVRCRINSSIRSKTQISFILTFFPVEHQFLPDDWSGKCVSATSTSYISLRCRSTVMKFPTIVKHTLKNLLVKEL